MAATTLTPELMNALHDGLVIPAHPLALNEHRKLDERYQGQEPALLDADLQIENRKWELGE